MDLGPDVAMIAGLMGEPARAAILVALVDGRARPAGELAFIGNIAPQTASFHLRKLMDAALITVKKQGKHSYYRLANEWGGRDSGIDCRARASA
jgi:DNA-binding transcriptional ArsR family regulator